MLKFLNTNYLTTIIKKPIIIITLSGYLKNTIIFLSNLLLLSEETKQKGQGDYKMVHSNSFPLLNLSECHTF